MTTEVGGEARESGVLEAWKSGSVSKRKKRSTVLNSVDKSSEVKEENWPLALATWKPLVT